MDQELISKKELLELTGISYGQLYRWKRKKLIPEDWFIRKSTFTGQETFFPKERILARVDQIKKMKEDLSLDEIAAVFSPDPKEIRCTRQELIKQNIVSKKVLDIYAGSDAEVVPFENILCLYIAEKALQTGEVTLEEGEDLIRTLEEHAERLRGRNFDLLFLRKRGVGIGVLVPGSSEVYVGNHAKVVIRFNIPNCIEELMIKIKEARSK